jgi:hypothetical protein
MPVRSVKLPPGEKDRKFVIKDVNGRKVRVAVILASTQHITPNLIPNGSIELYENGVLVAKAEVGRNPEHMDLCPEPPPPPPSYVPPPQVKARPSVVQQLLNR